MSGSDLKSPPDAEAYERLMRAYVDVLRRSERWPRRVARPLVAYYAQSHVGQRVTQLHTALVRAAAQPATVAGWTAEELDQRRQALERLAPTLQRRVTIGRLIAVVPLGAVAVGGAAKHVGWLNTHGVLISWLLVAAVAASLVADGYATWCFWHKFRLFADHVRGLEDALYRGELLSAQPEPRVAPHLWTLDVGTLALAGLTSGLAESGVVHGDAPAVAALVGGAAAVVFSLGFHGLPALRGRRVRPT